MNCSDKKNNNYHHGDLRNALIIAAAELIEESGSLDFAMIDAARRAGVSSAAPYRHFKDKDALLSAVTELAFWSLKEYAHRSQQDQEPGTAASIIAAGKCYIRFVTDHPQFYDLMWGDQGLRSLEQEQQALKNSGFYMLVDLIRTWCERHQQTQQDELEVAVKLWAMAHGLSGLALNGHIGKFIEDVDVYSLLESSTLTFLEGLKSSGSAPH